MSVETKINKMLEGRGGPQTFEIVLEAGFVNRVTEAEITEAVIQLLYAKQRLVGVQSYVKVEVEEIG